MARSKGALRPEPHKRPTVAAICLSLLEGESQAINSEACIHRGLGGLTCAQFCRLGVARYRSCIDHQGEDHYWAGDNH